jgi:signal transduction histidine kinase
MGGTGLLKGKSKYDGREMKTQDNTRWLIIEQVFPWLVLAILLLFTYAKFFAHPYGFRWAGSTGTIIYVFDQQPEPTLKVGDKILQIKDVTWDQFRADLRKTFFDRARPGDIVPIVVDRDGEIETIPWVYPPGPTRGEFLDQLISEWFVAYIFWLAGLLTVLVVRPKDERWLLMALFNFITAIWLIAGSGVSAFHVWGSALVLRMGVLLSVPVYLHLHWLFPQPFGKLSPILLRFVYTAALFLVIAQAFQLLPHDFYLYAFLVALGGSLILLLIHILRQPSVRRDLRLVFATVVMALSLALIWETAYSLNRIPVWLASGGLLGLPLLPLAYLYSAFRRRLSGLEMRVNRFFSTCLFVVLLGIVELPLIVFLDQLFLISAEASTLSLISSVLTAAAFIWVYPVFENFVEHRFLSIPLPSKRLLETFSTQITTSVSLPELIRVLQEEVFPSLLIRQFAFLQYEQGSLTVLSTMGLAPKQLPEEDSITDLLARAGFYRAPDPHSSDQPYSWIRLVLPLKLGNELLGFWLLGRRDPDDFYSQQEIPVISSLANLTAMALSNILQTERLRAMYEANIDRYEQERLRLSRDLHDSILNEMAALLIRGDSPVFSPQFQQAFEKLTERLREIVSDLRPPMLSFGLKYALDELAENLSERSQNSVNIEPHLHADGDWRYPDLVENHSYRIVQEACENALKYAHAKTIQIIAELSSKSFDIQVKDDGVGFPMDTNHKLNEMLANKHFGLVGMLERANLIGAEIDIHSKPGQGTEIRLRWRSRDSM